MHFYYFVFSSNFVVIMFVFVFFALVQFVLQSKSLYYICENWTGIAECYCSASALYHSCFPLRTVPPFPAILIRRRHLSPGLHKKMKSSVRASSSSYRYIFPFLCNFFSCFSIIYFIFLLNFPVPCFILGGLLVY